MKTYLSLILVLLLWTSCNQNSDFDELTFSQTQEEIGNIRLHLKKDKSFDLNVLIEPAAQLEIEGDSDHIEGIEEDFQGVWSIQGDQVSLIFSSDAEIEKIFNSDLDPKKTVTVINEKEAHFQKDVETIVIHGVDCQRNSAANRVDGSTICLAECASHTTVRTGLVYGGS
ncbi:hypothetical protein [Pseudopedobacter beijingensis]|uniref:Auto-transporter adhesin head GIN domain-containing protein n=1 Tax=Pseudopedobacter beijingensis TaxID=1207056 RepID=A0ABW4IGR7_9SPHI